MVLQRLNVRFYSAKTFSNLLNNSSSVFMITKMSSDFASM